MRTKLFLAALAGVALASCVTDKEYVETNPTEGVKIVFDSPVLYNNNTQTRANVYGEISAETVGEGDSYPTNELFQIYAVQHTGDLTGWAAATTAEFNDKPIAYESNIDGWIPIKPTGGFYFWPGGESKMSFAACSPADLACTTAERTYGATGLTIENFQVSPDASKQYDLMFSKRAINKTSTDMLHTEGQYSGIPIEFQHALSSIRFSLLNSSNEVVVLKKITLYGALDTGKFEEGIDESESINTYVLGTEGNVHPEWTPTTNRVAQTNAYIAFNGDITFPTGNPKYVADLDKEDNDTDINPDVCNVLLLMPQTLTDDVKIHVEYTVNGQLATKTVDVVDATKTDNKTNLTTWDMGTRYAYRLHYSAESANKDKIYFAPSSEGWKDAGAYEIELL